MTDLMDSDRTARQLPRAVPRAALWVGLALAALILVTVGYGLGNRHSGTQWREGRAYVGADQATITADHWDYGIPRSVAWVDERGGRHEDGWPDCLHVPAGTLVEHLRFATVDVVAAGTRWRQVVLVDCANS